MAIAKITVRTVEQLEPGSRVWDTIVQGFGVRRQTDGAYYYLRFRKNGVQQMRSIGRHGSPWTCERAQTASGPTARNRVRSSLSAFFNWAVREGLLDANPVAGTARADERGSRDRVLTQAELAELWAALPQGDFGEIVRLLILTGQRREEV